MPALVRRRARTRRSLGIPLARTTLVVQAALAALCVWFLYTQYGSFGPGTEARTVRAIVGDASGLDERDRPRVQVAGVDSGRVTGVRLDPESGKAVVTMKVEPDAGDVLRSDASVRIYPRSGLQDLVVDIDPGSADARLGDATIGRSAAAPVALDRVTRILDQDARAYVAILAQSLELALDGRSSSLRRAVARLPNATESVTRVTDLLAGRRTLLARLVTNLDGIAAETGRRSAQLTATVRLARATLTATGRRADHIERSMAPLADVLTQAEVTFDDVNRLGKPLIPALRGLRPVAQRLPSAVTALRRTLPTVRGTLTDAKPLVVSRTDDARRLGRALAALTPVASGLTRVIRSANLLLAELADLGPDIATFGKYWSGAISSQDGRLPITRALFFKFDDPNPRLFGLTDTPTNRAEARRGALSLLARTCRTNNLAACLALVGVKDGGTSK